MPGPETTPTANDIYHLFEADNAPDISEARRVGVKYIFWKRPDGSIYLSNGKGGWLPAAQNQVDAAVKMQASADKKRGTGGQLSAAEVGGTEALKGPTAADAAARAQRAAGVGTDEARRITTEERVQAVQPTTAAGQAAALKPAPQPTPTPTPTPAPTPMPTPDEAAEVARMVQGGLATSPEEALQKLRAQQQAKALTGVQP